MTLVAAGSANTAEQWQSPPLAAAGLTLCCAIAGVAGWVLGDTPLGLAANILAYVSGGILPLASAVRSLARGQLNVDLLMLVAAGGAAMLGDWSEGAVLLFLFSLSGTLENYAMYRTTRSIESLMTLQPREAIRIRNGVDERVPIESLVIGDLIQVHPGERFPIDAEVIDGETWADEATITGESTPVAKNVGDEVFAGTINGRGSVTVRMTRAVADTTLERIIQMVQQAQATKTPTQRLVEAWERPYVASVLAGAAITMLGSYWFHDRDWHDAFYHAMTLLVAASPCAVIASSPSALLSAIARGAFMGVLFKGAQQLEVLGAVSTVAFDKTGTLTQGEPVVTTVWTPDASNDNDVLRLAAAVERRSEHPLAETIVAEAARRGLTLPTTSDFESHTGLGVHARAEGHWVGVGREGLFKSHQVHVPDDVAQMAQRFRDEGQTALLVISDSVAVGVVAVADRPRPEAAAAIRSLRQLGIQRVIMLTGDHRRVANAVAAQVGADEAIAELLPDEKVLQLKRLLAGGERVAMVGDGVNDAPALAVASVGIAMGGKGTDVALEVADVVLVADDLKALPNAIWLCRLARRRVQQNIAFSFGMIGFLIISVFLGLPLWLTVIGHEGSTLLVVLNGVRMLGAQPPQNMTVL